MIRPEKFKIERRFSSKGIGQSFNIFPNLFFRKQRRQRFRARPRATQPPTIPQINIFPRRVQWTVSATPCQVDRVLHVIKCNSTIHRKNVTSVDGRQPVKLYSPRITIIVLYKNWIRGRKWSEGFRCRACSSERRILTSDKERSETMLACVVVGYERIKKRGRVSSSPWHEFPGWKHGKPNAPAIV